MPMRNSIICQKFCATPQAAANTANTPTQAEMIRARLMRSAINASGRLNIV